MWYEEKSYIRDALSFLYQKSKLGENKNIDQMPNIICERNAEIRAAIDIGGRSQSRRTSLDDIMFILDKVNAFPAVSGMASHMVGLILNETDRLMYSFESDHDGLFFYPKYAQSKVEFIMKFGCDTYQNILRGAIELGVKEAQHNVENYRRTGSHPCFNQRRKGKPAKLILLPGCKREPEEERAGKNA